MLSTSQGPRLDCSGLWLHLKYWLTFYHHVQNRPFKFLIDMSKHSCQCLHQISADRPRASRVLTLPFLCLVESHLTQLSHCHLKGKIICHPTTLCASYCPEGFRAQIRKSALHVVFKAPRTMRQDGFLWRCPTPYFSLPRMILSSTVICSRARLSGF